MFDVHRDGSITALEFHRALRTLGMKAKHESISLLILSNCEEAHEFVFNRFLGIHQPLRVCCLGIRAGHPPHGSPT